MLSTIRIASRVWTIIVSSFVSIRLGMFEERAISLAVERSRLESVIDTSNGYPTLSFSCYVDERRIPRESRSPISTVRENARLESNGEILERETCPIRLRSNYSNARRSIRVLGTTRDRPNNTRPDENFQPGTTQCNRSLRSFHFGTFLLFLEIL